MNHNKPIYLDYAATTPIDPRVMAAMSPYFDRQFGNPSSIHIFGQQAEGAIENARQMVSEDLVCSPQEVFFTACGTESDNLALRGVAFAMRKQNDANHLLITPVEHHAVSHTAQQLASEFGFELEYLTVDENGITRAKDVADRLRKDTAIVSVIYANNEIGTINPIADIGRICKERKIPFHVDAVQAAAHLPIDVTADNVDLMSIGAHKFYGPKGIGALFVRKGTPILPVMTGGGQEGGLRAGTQNVPYIMGLAEALRITQESISESASKLSPLRDRIIGRVLEEINEVKLTGDFTHRLPNHASFVFKGVDGNFLLTLLDSAGYACSSGSACKTGNPEPSEVLTAIRLPREWALGSLRITLGRGTSMDEVDQFLDKLPQMVHKARTNLAENLSL